MQTTHAFNVLDKYELRRTLSRASILEAFMESPNALSESDIEIIIENTCDRATIYRTLKTFMEKGLIHRVIDENNVVKYALCRETCQGAGHHGHHAHQHDHVHFKCQACGKTSCLDTVPIADVALPEGYMKVESNFLVIGVCRDCNQEKTFA